MSGLGEALAAPSAIAGLISLGTEVAKALYAVAAGIGAAGQEVREVALEVEMYSRTMEAIQAVLAHQDDSGPPKIMAVIERLLGICQPIFKMYDDVQKSLAPLLERFRDSKKKLEQVGLRFKWYFGSKRKVYACRGALKQQFAMLTPILVALGINRSGSRTQNSYHVQNIQVRVVLKNSAAGIESLHNAFGNGLRQLYSADRPSQDLLLPAEGPSGGSAEPRDAPAVGEPEQDESDAGANITETASSNAAALSSQSALVRYQPPGGDESNILPHEVQEIDRQVEETLDGVLKTVPYAEVEDIILETYSVEKQFIRLIEQILAGLGPEGAGVQPREVVPTPEATSPDPRESWISIEDPDGLQYKIPHDYVVDSQGLFEVLRRMGFELHGGKNFRDNFQSLEQNLLRSNLVLADSKDMVILSEAWERLLKPGMKVKVKRKGPRPDISKSEGGYYGR